MIDIDLELTPNALQPALDHFWEVSGGKIGRLVETYPEEAGTPVFTAAGRYTAQGWTEWTQGFLYGWSILQFDATGDERFLEMGRRGTVEKMASHVTHIGVHDHGFNNVSTYGNLRRLMLEGRIPFDRWELDFYEVALKASGAVQAARWSRLIDGTGYIHTFNGPHSLFCDTIRSVRALMLSHKLGHALMGENDERFSLLDRGLQHAANTARYVVFYGEGRDAYDVWGRVAHEAVFNMNDGRFRNSSTQQGYSPFSTWTRGLAWIMTGYAEELEFIATLSDEELEPYGGRAEIEAMMLKAARASCDFYIANSPTDGVPYWDTGAPGLAEMGGYLDRPSDPFNDHEPIDSSAAAIGCQGLLRLGRYLSDRGDPAGERYSAAGLTVLRTLLGEPYLSSDPSHQGLLLHGIYHRPRGWDYRPPGSKIPNGEAVMWGDYHLVEAALYTGRLASGAPYYTFFGS
jgi:hypothetical protein